MGLQISTLFGRLFSRKKKVKIAILGLDAAGKTTILYKLKLGEIITTIPTIGLNVETVEHRNVSFEMFDVGGGSEIYKLWPYQYAGCQAIIYVVDSSDRERVNVSREKLMYFLERYELTGLALLILANKQDLSNAMSVEEITEKFDLNRFKNLKWHVQPTCAKSGEGLYEGLEWLSKEL